MALPFPLAIIHFSISIPQVVVACSYSVAFLPLIISKRFTTMFSTEKISLFSLLLLFSMMGCQNQVQEKPALKYNPVPADFLIPGCNVGSTRWFELEEIPPNTNEQHIGLFLSTAGYPFMYDHCLCEVDQIKIPIGEIPNTADPVILQYSGTEELEHYVVYNDLPAYDTLMIVNPGEIYDPGLELMITLKGGDFNATLGNAGGLCIVDNLSGTYKGDDTLTVFTTPWRLAEPPTPTEPDSIIKIYIPKAMTIPY